MNLKTLLILILLDITPIIGQAIGDYTSRTALSIFEDGSSKATR
jgi:hypothetical protein